MAQIKQKVARSGLLLAFSYQSLEIDHLHTVFDERDLPGFAGEGLDEGDHNDHKEDDVEEPAKDGNH